MPLPQRLTALLALALFLWVGLLSVAPQLHHDVCGADAGSSLHQCVVTLLSKGQITPACSLPPLSLTRTFSVVIPRLQSVIWSSTDVRLEPSRGPPSLRS